MPGTRPRVEGERRGGSPETGNEWKIFPGDATATATEMCKKFNMPFHICGEGWREGGDCHDYY